MARASHVKSGIETGRPEGPMLVSAPILWLLLQLGATAAESVPYSVNYFNQESLHGSDMMHGRQGRRLGQRPKVNGVPMMHKSSTFEEAVAGSQAGHRIVDELGRSLAQAPMIALQNAQQSAKAARRHAAEMEVAAKEVEETTKQDAARKVAKAKEAARTAQALQQEADDASAKAVEAVGIRQYASVQRAIAKARHRAIQHAPQTFAAAAAGAAQMAVAQGIAARNLAVWKAAKNRKTVKTNDGAWDEYTPGAPAQELPPQGPGDEASYEDYQPSGPGVEPQYQAAGPGAEPQYQQNQPYQSAGPAETQYQSYQPAGPSGVPEYQPYPPTRPRAGLQDPDSKRSAPVQGQNTGYAEPDSDEHYMAEASVDSPIERPRRHIASTVSANRWQWRAMPRMMPNVANQPLRRYDEARKAKVDHEMNEAGFHLPAKEAVRGLSALQVKPGSTRNVIEAHGTTPLDSRKSAKGEDAVDTPLVEKMKESEHGLAVLKSENDDLKHKVADFRGAAVDLAATEAKMAALLTGSEAEKTDADPIAAKLAAVAATSSAADSAPDQNTMTMIPEPRMVARWPIVISILIVLVMLLVAWKFLRVGMDWFKPKAPAQAPVALKPRARKLDNTLKHWEI